MSRLAKFDDRIIDRIYQPIADRVPGLTGRSVFWLIGQILTAQAAAVLCVAAAAIPCLIHPSSPFTTLNAVVFGIAAPADFLWCRQDYEAAQKADQDPALAAAGLYREGRRRRRLLTLGILVSALVWALAAWTRVASGSDVVISAAIFASVLAVQAFLGVSAEYLLACVPPPPKPRRQPAEAAFAAGEAR